MTRHALLGLALALGVMAGGCDKKPAEPAGGGTPNDDESKRSLGSVMKASALVAKLEATADRACACPDDGCYEAASAVFDQIVGDNADVKLDEQQVKRAGTAAEKVLKCKAGRRRAVAPATTAASTDDGAAGGDSAEDGGQTAANAPSEDDRALAGLMAAVKARCGCKPTDKVCAMSGDGQLTTVMTGLQGRAFPTHLEAIRRSLVFEAEECSGKSLSAAEPGGAADDAARDAAPAPEATYARGKISKWSQLPRTINGLKHLLRMGRQADSPFIDAIWGWSVKDVLTAFPEAEKAEFDDLEPNTTRVTMELAEADRRGRQLQMEWRFLFGKLFMVTLDLKRSAPDLRDGIEAFMGRAPDAMTEEDYKAAVANWTDGNLLVRAISEGRSSRLSLAERAHHEAYTKRRKRPQEAYRANRLGLKALFSRPLTPHVATAEQHFREALQLVPHFGHAAVNLCRLLMLTGRLDQARARCRAARERSRNVSAHAESALYLGMLANMAGDRQGAATWFALAKGYGADDESVERMARRHLKLMNGKASKRDFDRPVRRIACALAEQAATRARHVAMGYGFGSAQGLLAAAAAKGVNVDKQATRAAKRCGRP